MDLLVSSRRVRRPPDARALPECNVRDAHSSADLEAPGWLHRSRADFVRTTGGFKGIVKSKAATACTMAYELFAKATQPGNLAKGAVILGAGLLLALPEAASAAGGFDPAACGPATTHAQGAIHFVEQVGHVLDVVAGDTLFSILERLRGCGVDQSTLLSLNPSLESGLQAGARLLLDAAPAAEQAATAIPTVVVEPTVQAAAMVQPTAQVVAAAVEPAVQTSSGLSELLLPFSGAVGALIIGAKVRTQMKRRGWTEEQIHEAMGTKGIKTQGKQGPATRYVHPDTGRSVVVDDRSGEVFHVGGDGFLYDD